MIAHPVNSLCIRSFKNTFCPINTWQENGGDRKSRLQDKERKHEQMSRWGRDPKYKGVYGKSISQYSEVVVMNVQGAKNVLSKL